MLCACTNESLHFARRPSAFDTPQADFSMAPKELYRIAKQTVTSPPISLSIESEKNGTFVTGYQEFPGAWHIARRWQERTRYRVTVIPDFDNPAGRGRMDVTEETETRAAEGQTWKTEADLARPERARDLLNQIQQRIAK